MLKMSYLISLHPVLFENIAHVKYFLNFNSVFVFVFVFVFFFIGLAVLGNRWHPHVVIRLIHCQFMDLHISYATLGLDFLRRIFFLHISWTRFQVSSRLEIFMAC